MPVYEYKALDDRGKTRKGIIDAESEAGARSRIRTLGQYPVEVRQSSTRKTGKGKGRLPVFTRLEHIPSRERTNITRQLATLLSAGIPLVQSLSSLAIQTRNPVLRKIVVEIKESVNEGSSLTNAMSGYPKVFSNVYINMVRAGEASGSLDVVLERLADFAEKQEEIAARLATAMIYPAVMAVVGTGILMFLITYIVPSITGIFADMKEALPLPTVLLLGISNVLRGWWWLVLILLLAGILSLRFFILTHYGRSFLDLAKLKMPVVGYIYQKILVARFASTLASLLQSGVGILASLQIVKNIMDNIHINTVVDEAIEQIRRGRSMSQTFGGSQWFPPMFIQMVSVGEQSGDLVPMLEKISRAYEQDAETGIMRMTALVEPLMIIIMGLVVAFIVFSILLPILEMNQMIG